MRSIFQSEIDLINARRAQNNYIDTLTLMEKIRERVFTSIDLGANYRWIDHWYSKGLLLSSYDKHKWKKFNLIEYAWIKIILKIREFDIGLQTVATVKEILDSDFTVEDISKNSESNFNELVTQISPSDQLTAAKKIISDPGIQNNIKEMQFNILEIMIMDILLLGNCYSILINTKGEIFPVKFSFLELYSNIPQFQNLIHGSFVSVSVTEILRDFIIEKDIAVNNKKRLALVTEEEALVLNTIRQDDLRSVIIRFDNDKKMNLLEEVREKKVDRATRLAELIMAKGYQDITIKTQNGGIVYCENKKKIMIQKK